ncbi:MAG: polyprenol monophosphomannose synthase [Candidatus Neomarinimicrobiota bacterium]|nr:polyprenol monophosphomannose synthase [Candidatus Neomarinimicrobiota bacterium]RKY50899.1 MAG: polyprenol monophosphomannose synthase [Candidatus Neomarinimicrobiota bacterium]
MAESLVIVPTYNEKDNIQTVVERVNALGVDIDILVVDDNSPDGTAEIVKELQTKYENLHLMERVGKLGLGSAYVAGFKWALKRDYEYILEMDADLSHNPFDIPRLINRAKEGYDVVIGSRYCNGVNVIHWPIKRLILSYGANKYTRMVTGLPIKDCTSGFKCYRREVLESIDLERIKSSGYSFQIEMKFRAWKKGFSLVEVPIIFEERSEGRSKMTKAIIYEAVFMVWKLKILSLLGLLK